ncbi:MAG: TetR/AcrR family transcriptional regulator [Eubacteriales bacterium]|nr:TetR/AcrR family transcriptional regulator [Eubacteriales bacterium]
MDAKQRMLSKQKSIIEAAIELFLKYSAKKTTVDDIAKKACVSKVTVYKYFSDKNNLYGSVCSHIVTHYYNKLEQQIASDMPLIEKMAVFVSVLTGFIKTGQKSLCIQLGEQNSEAEKEYTLFNNKEKDLMIQLIKQGKEEELIYVDIDDESIYHYINMGLCYFEHDTDYRERILHDTDFRQAFMSLIWRHVFTDISRFKAPSSLL